MYSIIESFLLGVHCNSGPSNVSKALELNDPASYILTIVAETYVFDSKG